MVLFRLVVVCLVGMGMACTSEMPTPTESAPLVSDSLAVSDDSNAVLPDGPGDSIWGYRFQVVGDYDGDGRLDTLKEHFTDLNDHETPKYWGNVGIDQGIYQLFAAERGGFLVDDERRLIPFEEVGTLGLIWAETIPDITGDGADEICILPDNADFSNVNTCRIYTYDQKIGWTLLHGEESRDWAFPIRPYVEASWPEDGGGVMLSLARTPENDSLHHNLLRHQEVKKIGSKTIEMRSFYPNDCSGTTDTAIRIEGNGAWFGIKKEALPINIVDYQVYVNFDEYGLDNQKKKYEKPEEVQIKHWCEGIDPYRVRITFR